MTTVLKWRVDNGGGGFFRTGLGCVRLQEYFAYKEQTEGGNTVLKKSFVALSGAALALLGSALTLSACVPSAKIESLGVDAEAGAEAEVAEASTEPRGFAFESGFLEFGDFDPYALGDDIFNPCTEITPEEYAAAGFPEIIVKDEGRTMVGLNSCLVSSTEEQKKHAVSVSFDNGNTNREMIEAQGLLYPEYRSELIPELFAFAAEDGYPGFCYTQIDTARGGFGASAGGDAIDVTTEEMCPLAIEAMEQLFRTFGSPNVH